MPLTNPILLPVHACPQPAPSALELLALDTLLGRKEKHQGQPLSLLEQAEAIEPNVPLSLARHFSYFSQTHLEHIRKGSDWVWKMFG